MVYCSDCGREIRENHKFCEGCGKLIPTRDDIKNEFREEIAQEIRESVIGDLEKELYPKLKEKTEKELRQRIT